MGQGFQVGTRDLRLSAIDSHCCSDPVIQTHGCPRWNEHHHPTGPILGLLCSAHGCDDGLQRAGHEPIMGGPCRVLRHQKELAEAVCVVDRSTGSGGKWTVTPGKGLNTLEPQSSHL